MSVNTYGRITDMPDNLKFVVEYVKEHYNPSGKNDKGGRWYPDEEEKCTCCNNVRSPSRSYLWSLWKHCQTKKHVKNWVLKQTDSVYKEALAMTQETAAIYINTDDEILAYVRDHVYGLHINSNPIKEVIQKQVPGDYPVHITDDEVFVNMTGWPSSVAFEGGKHERQLL